MPSLSRRTFLGSTIAAMGGCPALSLGVANDRLPTLTELGDRVRQLKGSLGAEAKVERLGASKEGRPIDLISVGRGPLSVLVVGAPHANEPIGCLTVATMLESLAHDRAFRQESGITWHFIPAIDADGVAMNEGWFSEPRTLDSYFRSFFRPAFALQPEYSFPLNLPGYHFDAATPENLCWQGALEHTRPAMQSSLHGNESTGVFYLLSENRPRLVPVLAAQPLRYGMGVDRLGEPDADMRPFAPGVLSSFEVKPMIERAVTAGHDPRTIWTAGQSSAEFAHQRFQTFSMICEIPLWDDPRLHTDRPSHTTMADVLRELFDQAKEDRILLEAAATLPDRSPPTPDSAALDAALREAASRVSTQVALFGRQLPSADRAKPLSLCDLVQYESGTAGMRTPAMIARRAKMGGDTRIALLASQALSRRIGHQLRKSTLTPIPYRRSVALQMEAIIATASRLP